MFNCYNVSDTQERGRHFTLNSDDIILLNPNTKTCPVFHFSSSAELTKAIYRRVPVLVKNGPPEENSWGVVFRQGLFNMTSASHLFMTRQQLESSGWKLKGNVMSKGGDRYLPLYEAKMMNQFNHRFSSYEALQEGTRSHMLPESHLQSLQDPRYCGLPFYFVSQSEVTSLVTTLTTREWLIGLEELPAAASQGRLPTLSCQWLVPETISLLPHCRILCLACKLLYRPHEQFCLGLRGKAKSGGTEPEFLH